MPTPISNRPIPSTIKVDPQGAAPNTTIRFPSDAGTLPQVKPGTTRLEMSAAELEKHVKGARPGGEAQWKGTLNYSIDGGAPVKVEFAGRRQDTKGNDIGHAVSNVDVQIPKGSHELTFWVELEGAEGKSYVSNFGNNFKAAVEGANPNMPPVRPGPAPGTATSDRWGNVISVDPVKPKPVEIDPNPNRAPTSDRWGNIIADGDGNKVDWK